MSLTTVSVHDWEMMGQLDFLVTLAAFSFFVGLQSYEDGQQYETP